MSSELRRRACVLIPLFSIRGAGWGLGEVPDLPGFTGWARSAGFRMVQLLPVGEVCGGETSPYAASSAFALDPIYLGLDSCEDFRLAGGREALSPADRAELEAVSATPAVVWERVRRLKERAAGLAFTRFLRDEWQRESERARALARFREQHAAWLEDYALFAVLHDRFQKSWLDWPTGLRDRAHEALAAARQEHHEAILGKAWMQWQLDLQWHAARAQAREQGVELMGDLPFVVSTDSADVWARRDSFRPEMRVGTPPDAFSADGQDWGLPLYDWQAMERSGFEWMRKRAARVGDLYDSYRVDHVIGLYRTYYRKPGEKEGSFIPTEEAAQVRLGETVLKILAEAGEVVAEDLGMVPPFLRPSLTELAIPGYKVLRWEKDDAPAPAPPPASENGSADPPPPPGPRMIYRDPASYPALSVATSGTHDIETNAEWYDALPEDERAALTRVPGLERLAEHPKFDDAVRDALLRVIYAAPSEIVAVPFQDALGTRERINLPGTVVPTNWTYRMPMKVAALHEDRATADRLARLSTETGR
jgi:4-alpha-glucanotransferase